LIFRQTLGGGQNFVVTGIPLQFADGLPLSPEMAVKAVFELTAVRIREVPRFYNQFDGGRPYVAPCASWRLHMERSVLVSGVESGTSRPVDELFARRSPGCASDTVAFFAALADQPTTFRLSFPSDTTAGDSQADTAFVSVVGPMRFERVTFPRRTP
jgi:hypothetical protein